MAKVGLQLYEKEFILLSLLIIVLFSIQMTVNLLLPHPVFNFFPSFRLYIHSSRMKISKIWTKTMILIKIEITIFFLHSIAIQNLLTNSFYNSEVRIYKYSVYKWPKSEFWFSFMMHYFLSPCFQFTIK